MGSGSSAAAKYAAPVEAKDLVGRVPDAELQRPYDLIVIGGGPAGVAGALKGAYLGKRVLLVDLTCMHTLILDACTAGKRVLLVHLTCMHTLLLDACTAGKRVLLVDKPKAAPAGGMRRGAAGGRPGGSEWTA